LNTVPLCHLHFDSLSNHMQPMQDAEISAVRFFTVCCGWTIQPPTPTRVLLCNPTSRMITTITGTISPSTYIKGVNSNEFKSAEFCEAYYLLLLY